MATVIYMLNRGSGWNEQSVVRQESNSVGLPAVTKCVYMYKATQVAFFIAW